MCESNMTTNQPETPAVTLPLAQLERALIDLFLRARGYDSHALAGLPESQRQLLLAEASVYASARLTEVESRSRFLHDIHGIRALAVQATN
jgi:hypothetical protein